jgi:uncharacterized RDD family membrane protein YckC
MAHCTNCGHEMSDMAAACPNCGHPNESRVAVAAATSQYANWGQRVDASLIDSLIIAVPSWIIMAILGIGLAASNDLTIDPDTGRISGGDTSFLAGFFVGMIVILGAGILYKVLMEGGPRGQTLGKMALKIRVVDAKTGGPIGYGKAALRWFVAAILWWVLYIPGIVDVLFPLWDAKRQTLHDKAASTVVVPVA